MALHGSLAGCYRHRDWLSGEPRTAKHTPNCGARRTMKLTVNVDDRIVAIARKTWGIARHRASHFMLAGLVLAGVGTIAHATTKKHTFTSGTAALAAQVNENFDDLFAA